MYVQISISYAIYKQILVCIHTYILNYKKAKNSVYLQKNKRMTDFHTERWIVIKNYIQKTSVNYCENKKNTYTIVKTQSRMKNVLRNLQKSKRRNSIQHCFWKKDRKKMKKSEHRVERNLRKNGRRQVEQIVSQNPGIQIFQTTSAKLDCSRMILRKEFEIYKTETFWQACAKRQATHKQVEANEMKGY